MGETTITVNFNECHDYSYGYYPQRGVEVKGSKNSMKITVAETKQEGTTFSVNPTQEGTTAPTNPPEIISGDLDGDGKSGASDIVKMTKYLHHKEWTGNPQKADLNGDNVVNVIDLRQRLVYRIAPHD